MTTETHDLTLDTPAAGRSLAETVHAADNSAFLVEPRVLRRVIKEDCHVAGFGMNVPHRKGYVVAREKLLEFVDADEIHPRGDLPRQVILLPLPDDIERREASPETIAHRRWRWLFHARVHLHLHEQAERGQLTKAEVKRRIHRIGQTQFDEARFVLLKESMLLAPRDETENYIEFAAMFLQLRKFDEELVSIWFPTVGDPAATEAILCEDNELDAAALVESTRPAGAPADPRCTWPDEYDQPPPSSLRDSAAASFGDPRKFDQQARRAEQRAKVGNQVGAAIRRLRAARFATPDHAELIASDAGSDLRLLVERLQSALDLSYADVGRWHAAVMALLEACRNSWLSREARLLYDLQRVCVDHERNIYTIDLPEWVLSLFRRPIRRRLPALREVLMCKHLRSALRRLPGVRISAKARSQLSHLLHEALHHAEHDVRQRMRPLIEKGLSGVGLDPLNPPERVARNKIVEELLDRIVNRGYLRYGDLRDAISRNNLKLPDMNDSTPLASEGYGWLGTIFVNLALACASVFRKLTPAAARSRLSQWGGAIGRALPSWIKQPLQRAGLGLHRLWIGDHLLCADRKLALYADGVHHRAEVYLRVFQRFSAVFFGLALGRWITKLVLLPFIGAFIIVVGAQEMAKITKLATIVPIGDLVAGLEAVARGAPWSAVFRHHTGSVAAFAICFLLLLGLVNSAYFRAGFARTFRLIGKGIAAGIEFVRDVFGLPQIRRLLQSRAFRFTRRFFLKPLLFTALTWLVIALAVGHVPRNWPAAVGVFLLLNLLLNTRFARDAEELTNDWLARNWRRFRIHVLMGLFHLIVDFFKAALEWVDRVLYAVDEWLRFRQGESTLSFLFKAVFGTLWYVVTYVFRFGINLLLEPQVNPIKHFPVVTVSHKLLLPLAITSNIKTVASPLALLVLVIADIPIETANWIAGIVVWGIPGIFGFLAWELKENWRLYRANRPAKLKPAAFGAHGETMVRFVRPGIHSGTLPKLYRKLRKAEKKRRETGKSGKSQKLLDQLEHERHLLQHFVERDLVEVLRDSPRWRHALRVGRVDVGGNRVRVELLCPEVCEEPASLAFEEQSGWLVAHLAAAGFVERLDEADLALFRNALVGHFKACSVHLVRPQIESCLPRPDMPYDIAPQRLVVWPEPTFTTRVTYELSPDLEMAPDIVGGAGTLEHFQVLQPASLLFGVHEVAWADWLAAWPEHPGAGEPPPLCEGIAILPRKKSPA